MYRSCWGRSGTAIEGWGHLLMIRQSVENHHRIRKFLKKLRDDILRKHRRIHILTYVSDEHDQQHDKKQYLCAVLTSNRRKALLKSGCLTMSDSAKELRDDIARGLTWGVQLQDTVEKRRGYEMEITPTAKENSITAKVQLTIREEERFRRTFTVTLKNGQATRLCSLGKNRYLYMKASFVEEQ